MLKKCRKSVENDIFTLISGLRGCPCGTSLSFNLAAKIHLFVDITKVFWENFG